MTEALKKEIINSQLNNSMIPKKYRKNVHMTVCQEDVDAFNTLKGIEKNAQKFVNEGHNLYIYSAICGNGKTTYACNIAKSYIENYSSNFAIDTPVVFISASDFLEKRKLGFDDKTKLAEFEELVEKIESAKLVIWDDIATKSASEYDMEQLYIYINRRLADDKSNIYTSNASGDLLKSKLGERLYSRIYADSVQVELKGKDKRGDKSVWYNCK